MYTIDELKKTFLEYEELRIITNEILIQEWKKNNPDSEIPDYFNTGFSMCMALHHMCSEIIRLRDK